MKFKAMELESYVKFLCSFKGLLPIVVNFSWFLSVYKKGVVLIFNAHLIFFFFLGAKKELVHIFITQGNRHCPRV